MIDRFLILNHGDPRPDAERIIYCDGAGGNLFREAADLELRHWRPNRTPREYRAGTSTECCFRFLDAPRPGDWTLAVNNHLDVDGMLSVYVLVHAAHAVDQRRTIIEAAEMGDFWGWGEAPAQRLFQGLTRLMTERSAEGRSVQSIYDEAFRRVPGLIDGTDPESANLDESLAPLREGVALVEQGRIRRVPRGDRFTQYVIPSTAIPGAVDHLPHAPGFNEAISTSALLWPHARAKWDVQRLCLVSSETTDGWLHDLWFPGYLWADTEHLWTFPGMRHRDGMESYELVHAGLSQAIEKLNQAETANGAWASGGDETSPFHSQLQRLFPIVVRFVDQTGKPMSSRLSADHVATEFAAPFASI